VRHKARQFGPFGVSEEPGIAADAEVGLAVLETSREGGDMSRDACQGRARVLTA